MMFDVQSSESIAMVTRNIKILQKFCKDFSILPMRNVATSETKITVLANEE